MAFFTSIWEQVDFIGDLEASVDFCCCIDPCLPCGMDIEMELKALVDISGRDSDENEIGFLWSSCEEHIREAEAEDALK